MRSNKKGFLRIVEASVSILAIASVLFLLYTGTREQVTPEYTTRGTDIVQILANNVTLRNTILGYNTSVGTGGPNPIPSALNLSVKSRIPESFLSYEIRICEVTDVCGQTTFIPGGIFSSERIISANLTELAPRKVKLFIWENA